MASLLTHGLYWGFHQNRTEHQIILTLSTHSPRAITQMTITKRQIFFRIMKSVLDTGPAVHRMYKGLTCNGLTASCYTYHPVLLRLPSLSGEKYRVHQTSCIKVLNQLIVIRHTSILRFIILYEMQICLVFLIFILYVEVNISKVVTVINRGECVLASCTLNY